MPPLKNYDLFISHAWQYNEDYYRLEKLLNATNLFKWRNYSVPEHDPVINPNTQAGKKKLIEALDRQVRPVNCVLIIAGMYVPYKEWIQKEIELSQQYGKPIIGVIPRGNTQVPRAVQDVASDIVGWNTDSIVTAIRKHSI